MGVRHRPRTKVEMLKQAGVFAHCSQRELEHIARIADEVQVRAGHVLTREGNQGREFFLVQGGKAAVRVRGRRVATLTAGNWFGEMSLLDHGPRTATVVADTDMRMYVVESRAFAALLDEVPALARSVMAALAARLRAADATLTAGKRVREAG